MTALLEYLDCFWRQVKSWYLLAHSLSVYRLLRGGHGIQCTAVLYDAMLPLIRMAMLIALVLVAVKLMIAL